MFGANKKLEKFNLTKFDYTNLDELDPSSKNYNLIKNVTIKTEIQIIDNQNNKTILEHKEPIDYKLYKKKNCKDFKLELISDNDIFFFYSHK